MSSSDTYEIYALRYGFLDRNRQSNFRDPIDDPDAEMSMDYYIWAIRNDERTVIVDTGFDHGEGKRRGRTVERLPAAALASLGINATLVEDVVITHLHYDHAGTLSHFPSAKFHIQEQEMRFATGKWMLDNAERVAYTADHVAELVYRLFEKRVVFHDGDGEVAPGITVHCMPGSIITPTSTAATRESSKAASAVSTIRICIPPQATGMAYSNTERGSGANRDMTNGVSTSAAKSIKRNRSKTALEKSKSLVCTCRRNTPRAPNR